VDCPRRATAAPRDHRPPRLPARRRHRSGPLSGRSEAPLRNLARHQGTGEQADHRSLPRMRDQGTRSTAASSQSGRVHLGQLTGTAANRVPAGHTTLASPEGSSFVSTTNRPYQFRRKKRCRRSTIPAARTPKSANDSGARVPGDSRSASAHEKTSTVTAPSRKPHSASAGRCRGTLRRAARARCGIRRNVTADRETATATSSRPINAVERPGRGPRRSTRTPTACTHQTRFSVRHMRVSTFTTTVWQWPHTEPAPWRRGSTAPANNPRLRPSGVGPDGRKSKQHTVAGQRFRIE
jgi:hypothetical protein